MGGGGGGGSGYTGGCAQGNMVGMSGSFSSLLFSPCRKFSFFLILSLFVKYVHKHSHAHAQIHTHSFIYIDTS